MHPTEEIDEHFVDTNVLLGYSVEWDRLGGEIAAYLEYVDDEYTLYSSSTALEEAEYVVREQRRLAKQAARLVFRQFEPSGSHDEIDHIIKFVHRELGEEDGHDTSGLGGLLNFVEAEKHRFEGLTNINEEETFKRLVGEIDEEFRPVIRFLETIRDESTNGTPFRLFRETRDNYEDYYSQYSRIADLLPGEPNDCKILFDAYHLLSTMSFETIGFVTADHDDFLSNRDAIEGWLTGILIASPENFCELASETEGEPSP